jgi:hypothetical protein
VEVERLLHGQEEVDVEVLRREADRAARRLVVVDRVVAEDRDLAAGRLREPGRAVDQRRLAGAVGPEQAEELTRLDVERDALERLDAGGVALDEVGDLQCLRNGIEPIGRSRAYPCPGLPPLRSAITRSIRP